MNVTGDFTGLPPIFRDCEARDDSVRYSGPMRQGDYIYATDGRIAVRTLATNAPMSKAEVVDRPKFSQVFDKSPPVEEAVTSLGAIDDWPPLISCPECKGRGSVNCNMGHWHECDACVNGEVADTRHVALTSAGGNDHRICHCWAAILKRHNVALHMPVKVGGVAKFHGEWDGVKFEGVVTTVDPLVPCDTEVTANEPRQQNRAHPHIPAELLMPTVFERDRHTHDSHGFGQ